MKASLRQRCCHYADDGADGTAGRGPDAGKLQDTGSPERPILVGAAL